MKKIRTVQLACLCLLISFPHIASAMMIELSVEALTRASQTVIVGEVETLNSVWNEAGDIVTRATVAVEEIVKGDLNEGYVTVEYEGGEIGDIGLKVSNSPSLTQGEEVILFLEPKPETTAQSIRKIVGEVQGKYAISKNGIARRDGFQTVTGKSVHNSLPVNELLNRIRNVK